MQIQGDILHLQAVVGKGVQRKFEQAARIRLQMNFAKRIQQAAVFVEEPRVGQAAAGMLGFGPGITEV
ncbi:hypothetical protein D3C81_2289770 [compost metagenome]